MVGSRRRRSALLQTVVQLLKLVGSAKNTVPLGSAPSAVAPLPPNRLQKERAASTAVAAEKCARRQAAPRLLWHAASAGCMVLSERARWMAAPPTQSVVALHIARNTVVEGKKAAVLRAGLQRFIEKSRLSTSLLQSWQAMALRLHAVIATIKCGRG